MIHITISRRAALILAVALLLVVPATAGATHIFSDVEDTNTHATGIEWVADVGVTTGCGDGSTYCPDGLVNRAQMATFMHRLSGNVDGIEPSVNAASVGGVDADSIIAGQSIARGVHDTTSFYGTGITGVTRPQTGLYCFSLDTGAGLANNQVVAVVGTEWGNSATNDLFAHVESTPAAPCAPTELAVRTFVTEDDVDGNVIGVQESNSVAWTIVVYSLGDGLSLPNGGFPLGSNQTRN